MIPPRASRLPSALLLTIAALVAFGSAPARAVPAAEAAAGRKLMARYADAVIGIELVVTMKITLGERSMPPRESRMEANGTVISPAGLTVVSLNEVDPKGTLQTMLRGQRGGQAAVVGDTEYKEVKLRLTDGTEVPARIVLKDPDLDLAFIAPLPGGAARTFASVQLDHAADPEILGTYFVISRAPKSMQRIPEVRESTLNGIVAKPRKFFEASVALLGCPMFSEPGGLLGVCLAHVVNGGPTLGGGRGVVVVPSADLQDEVKQAEAAAAKPAPTPAPADDDDAPSAAASAAAPAVHPK